MKRVFNFLLAIILSGNFALAQNKKSDNLNHQKMKILFVLTSHDQLGNTGEKTGFWIEEFATPYYFFTDKGIEVTIASPKGGQPPIDPKSNLPDYSTPATKKFYADKSAQEKLSKTLTLSEVNQKNYDAIFYPGGHGPMWDLAEDTASIKLIESFRDVDASKVTVEEAMTEQPYTVAPEMPLDEVVSTMAEKKYGSAVIVQNHKVVGIFTTVDACQALAELLSTRLAK